jgi:outer membrane receptor protein involved in Fe transport
MKNNFRMKITILKLAEFCTKTYLLMKRLLSQSAALLLCLFTTCAFAQNVTITGKIRDAASKEVIGAVTINAKGTTASTNADDNGNFRLVLPASVKFPVTLEITHIGYTPQEVVVNNAGDFVEVNLVTAVSLGQEVVVSGTRTPTRILESPVSVERIGTAAIRNTTATSFYDMVGQLKGVDLVASSLTFKTPSTRGFNGSGNTRFNQLTEMMDNQAPGLNFSVGNFSGLTELDVESVELLPGASSALYGPGGTQGTLLIASKNPFKYQGLSFQVKTGVNHVDKRQRDGAGWYNDWSLRWAHKIGNRFAFKITTQLVQAKDWVANDARNYNRTTSSLKTGDRNSDPNYDGVNIYGDETSVDVRKAPSGGTTVDIWSLVGQAIIAGAPAAQQPLVSAAVASIVGNTPASLPISRTGYLERQTVNPNTINYKLGGSLNYKLTNRLEAILLGYFGTGSTVYTGSDRYSLKDAKIGQYKFELKSKSWFLRAYTTQENAGEAYNATITTRLFNETWKPTGTWLQQYSQGFLVSAVNLWATTYLANIGQGQAAAAAAAQAAVNTTTPQFHIGARGFADQGRPVAGSAAFNSGFDAVRKRPIPQGGLFLDKSDLYMVEGQYNFSEVISAIDIIIGGNWKQYVLNSQGTLFIDYDGPIKINEVGGYAQLTKRLFADKLTLSASGRFDKNSNFKGRFTPRATALVKLAKDHNVRVSYQSAYRFPTTQQQYINLEIGGGVFLVGGLPWIKDAQLSGGKAGPNLGTQPALRLNNNGVPIGNYEYRELKPEVVNSYEIGYKGLVRNKLLIDAYAYLGRYENFIGRVLTAKPVSPGVNRIYSIVENASNITSGTGGLKFSPIEVKTIGFGFGLDYQLPAGFSVYTNFYHDEIKDVPANFVANFNTPENRITFGFANSGMGPKKKIGFNITGRWQEEFLWEGDFATGPVPSFFVLDAAISYKVSEIRSLVKVGATNLFNKYYLTAFGNPQIGGLYYVSFAYNVFSN